jgi:hypothetical protein
MLFPIRTFSLALFSSIPVETNGKRPTYHIKDSLGGKVFNININFTIFGDQKCINVLAWLHRNINFK